MKLACSIFLILSVITLSACGKSPEPMPTAVEPSPTAIVLPTPTSTTEPTGITLTYGDNAQVELVNTAGRHIYIDISYTNYLTKEPSADDILLTTHLHGDHYYASFQQSFPGQQIFATTGQIELPDVSITSIPSAHLPNDPIKPENSTNYIFIIETSGLRIVHFGDIGQDTLSDEQLAEIGPVDLAITQFSNSYSMMNADNLKGFNLMDQVQPRLILPTHSDRATIEIAAGRWQGYYSESRTVAITTDNIPAGRSILILGNSTLLSAYVKLFGLQEWK